MVMVPTICRSFWSHVLKKFFTLFALVGAFSLAYAADEQVRPQGGHEKNPAIEAAMKECASTSAKEANGRPDRAAMEKCMTAKGYARPAHPEGGRGRPPRGEKGVDAPTVKE